MLVVGAGPAGLECAIVLAKRGFGRVHLVTADAEIGGHHALGAAAARARRVGPRARLAADPAAEAAAQVELITGERLTAADVRDYGAELVVIATGSHWSPIGLNGVTRGPIPGADASLPHCLTPEQVMLEGKRPPGSAVVVYDCDGYYAGAGHRRAAARRGQRGDDRDAAREGRGGRRTRRSRARCCASTCTTSASGWCRSTRSARSRPAACAASDVYGDAFELACDGVVLTTQRLRDDALFRELVDDPGDLEGVYAIGDCVAPRVIADAIWDGHRLAREIDTADPATPLPWKRERTALA